MQKGLLAVLVTIIVAGIAAVAAYTAGYQAGLVASGGAVVAPIVYGGGAFACRTGWLPLVRPES